MRCHPRTAVVAASLCACVAAAPCSSGAQTLVQPPLTPSSPPPQSSRPSPSLRGIFSDTLADFKNIPSLESATILSIGGFGSAVGHGADSGVSRTLSASPGLHGFLRHGETIGGARAQIAGALATYTLGRAMHHPVVTTVGADLIRAQLVTQALTATLKTAVRRTRPDGTAYSFPSGHTSTSFATATVLQRNLGWKVGIPAYGVAAYVAASRIQVRRHYLSDVTFGAALGIVAGRAVTIGRGDARFAVSPAAAPGGAGVSLTWLGRQ